MLPTESNTEASQDHYIDAKLYVNQAYWDMCGIKAWRWARKQLQFSSIGSTAVTISSISGSTVTLSATLTPTALGKKIYFDSEGIPNRITAHTAGTSSLTIQNASYTGDSTSGTATIYNDEVSVATDILGFPVITELHWGDFLIPIPEDEALQKYPRNIFGTTRAKYYTFINSSTIRIMPWTTSARLFEIAYNYRPAALDFTGAGAGDTPILPQESRFILVPKALQLLYKDKRDGRLAAIGQELKDKMDNLTSSELTLIKPRIWVRRGSRVSG
mgnify:FL=1